MLRATSAETAKLESWLWGRGDQRPGKRVNVRGSSSSAGNNHSAVFAHWRVRRRGDEAGFGLGESPLQMAKHLPQDAGERYLWKSAVFQGGHFTPFVHLILSVVGRASCA